MIFNISGQTDPTENSDSVFSANSYIASGKTATTHDFTDYRCGVDYYFELTSFDTRAYMTGQGRGIKPNDYILLQFESMTHRYQVETIDYYSHPSDMWIALLKLIA